MIKILLDWNFSKISETPENLTHDSIFLKFNRDFRFDFYLQMFTFDSRIVCYTLIWKIPVEVGCSAGYFLSLSFCESLKVPFLFLVKFFFYKFWSFDSVSIVYQISSCFWQFLTLGFFSNKIEIGFFVPILIIFIKILPLEDHPFLLDPMQY